MADLKTFAEQLVNLSVKEVSELADILKNEYGIEPAATAVAAPAAAVAASCPSSPLAAHGAAALFPRIRPSHANGTAECCRLLMPTVLRWSPNPKLAARFPHGDPHP